MPTRGRFPTQAERKRVQDYKKKYGTIKVDGKKFEMDDFSPYRTKALATKAAQRLRKKGFRAVVRVGKNKAGKRVYRVYRGPASKVNYKMLGF